MTVPSTGPTEPGRDPLAQPPQPTTWSYDPLAQPPQPVTWGTDPFAPPTPGQPLGWGQPAPTPAPPLPQGPAGQVPRPLPGGTPPPPPRWNPPVQDGGRMRGGLRRNLGLTIASVLVVAVVGFVCYGLSLGRSSGTTNTGQQSYATETHPAGVFATTSATANPDGPFADTPAATWPKGAAGITIPAATAVEGFTKAQVAADLTTVQKALVAARLDPRMLVNHDPSTLLALIASDDRSYVKDLVTHSATDGGAITGLATLLGSGAQLDSLGPRVNGRTSFAVAEDKHNDLSVLQVVTNYVWVYGFTGYDGVVVVHDEIDWWFYRSADVHQADLGAWPASFEGYGQNIDCADFNHGLVAPPSTNDIGLPATGGPVDPDQFFDPDHSLSIANTCGTPSASSSP